MILVCYGGGVSVWQNKNPTAGWQWGLGNSGERLKTRLPRGAAAARLAAEVGHSNGHSQSYPYLTAWFWSIGILPAKRREHGTFPLSLHGNCRLDIIFE
jgi:hypothetical protein